MLAKFANALALSWPQTKNLPAMSIVELTGIPVRQAFFDAAQTPYRLAATTPVHIAVLGGSQGASILASWSQMLLPCLTPPAPALAYSSTGKTRTN